MTKSNIPINKMKEKTSITIAFLMMVLMISGVFGEGDICSSCGREFGKGIYKNAAGTLYKNGIECQNSNPGMTCNQATADELINKKDQAVELQDSMTKDQAEKFNKLKTKEDLGVELEGNHLSNGIWKDENTFVYGENEFTKELLEENGIKKLSLNGNIITGTNKNDATIKFDNIFKLENPRNYQMTQTSYSAPIVGQDSFGRGTGGLGGLGQGGGDLGSLGQGGLDQQAIGTVQQLVSFLGSILGPLKEQRSNGQGQTNTKGNGGGFISTFDGGAMASFEDEKGNSKLLVGQNNPKNPAKVETEKGNKVAVTNVDLIVPQQVAAKISDKTSLTLAGTSGNDPNNQAKTSQEKLISFKGVTYSPTFANILSLLPKFLVNLNQIPQKKISTATFSHIQINEDNENKITGKAISDLGGQSIELLEHNLEINGHDINTYALKTFNELNAGGQNLKFYSGDYQIKFNNQQTLVSRLHQDIPYGVKKISNKLDQKNEFTLQHYTNKLLFLTDDNRIVSISDITTEHPTNNRLVISEIRKNMWSKQKV